MASIDLTFYYTLLPSISIFSISQYLITLFFTLFHSPQFSFYIFNLSVSILHFISIYFILFYSLSILTISQFLPLTLNLSLSVSHFLSIFTCLSIAIFPSNFTYFVLNFSGYWSCGFYEEKRSRSWRSNVQHSTQIMRTWQWYERSKWGSWFYFLLFR